MKLHLPGYFLATFQASIELITKLDRKKFLTREMMEQELKHGQPNGSPTGASNVGGERTRRPSYLSSGAGINGALSSSLPRGSSHPIDAASSSSSKLQHGALPPGAVSAGSQPRPGVGIRHVQPVMLNAGQTIAPKPASSRAGGNAATTVTGASLSNSVLPQAPPAQLHINVAAAGSGSVTPPLAAFTSGGGVPRISPSSNVSPASASSRATTSTSSSHAHSSSVDSSSTQPRSQSFHSSPGLRLDDVASTEGNVASSSWSQPFTVVAEHFSHPNTPSRVSRRASGNANAISTLQQAIGQMRGM